MKATYTIEDTTITKVVDKQEVLEYETRVEMTREDGRVAVKYVSALVPITEKEKENALGAIARVLNVTEYNMA